MPIPESVRAALGVPSERVYGADRYSTAAALAEYAFEEGWTTMADAGVATGIAFPDGLTGGAALGVSDGVLLLTRSTSLPFASESALSRHLLDVTDVRIIGGSQAASAGVEDRVNQILR